MKLVKHSELFHNVWNMSRVSSEHQRLWPYLQTRKQGKAESVHFERLWCHTVSLPSNKYAVLAPPAVVKKVKTSAHQQFYICAQKYFLCVDLSEISSAGHQHQQHIRSRSVWKTTRWILVQSSELFVSLETTKWHSEWAWNICRVIRSLQQVH